MSATSNASKCVSVKTACCISFLAVLSFVCVCVSSKGVLIIDTSFTLWLFAARARFGFSREREILAGYRAMFTDKEEAFPAYDVLRLPWATALCPRAGTHPFLGGR